MRKNLKHSYASFMSFIHGLYFLSPRKIYNGYNETPTTPRNPMKTPKTLMQNLSAKYPNGTTVGIALVSAVVAGTVAYKIEKATLETIIGD